jgi:hypothetical protein
MDEQERRQKIEGRERELTAIMNRTPKNAHEAERRTARMAELQNEINQLMTAAGK